MSTRAPELQSLIDKADELRRKETHTQQAKELRRKERRRRPKPARTAGQASATLPFGIYYQIHDDHLGTMWWLLPLLFLPAMWAAAEFVHWVVAIPFALALPGRLIHLWIGIHRGWQQCRGFPQNLDLPLEGWSSLMSRLQHQDPEEWCEACVIELHKDSSLDESVVEAACDLFLAAANRWFYRPDGPIGHASPDPRRKWRRDGYRLSGSANIDVAGEIYRLSRRLELIKQRSGGLQRIHLRAGGELHRVSRPSYSGD